jgi:hypothetical protein
MKRTAMTKTETIEVQMWKVGDSVVAKDTEFAITEGKVYKILSRSGFYDCFAIVDDTGKEEVYSQEYFDLVLE